MGLDLRSVDIGCDGNTGDDQEKVSKYTDFPALIERLQRENDWAATETFSCFKERKYAESIAGEDPSDNFEFQAVADVRAAKCRLQCANKDKLEEKCKSCC